MWIFKAALFIQIQNWRQATCLLTDEWIIKLCYICTMEYYSAIKKLIQGTTWVNIKHIMFFKVYNVTVLLFSQSCVSIISATFRTLQYVPAPSPKKLGPFSCHPPPNLHLSVFVPLEICLFWKFHINGVKQYMTFCYLHLSVQFSRSVVSDSLQPHESQHTRPPCPSPTPGVHPNPCPSSRWCHPIISSSVVPFSSCPQSFPAPSIFSSFMHDVACISNLCLFIPE